MTYSESVYFNWARERKQALSTGDSLLDKAFRITEFTAIRTADQIGGLAVLLQIAESMLKQGFVVAFVDQAADAYFHKIAHLVGNPNFKLFRPTDPNQMIELSNKWAYSMPNTKRCYIFAQSYWANSDTWHIRTDFTAYASSIKHFDPNCYLIFEVQPYKIHPDQGWNVVDIENVWTDYVLGTGTTNQSVGHVIEISKPVPERRELVKHYVNYNYSCLSRGWEIAYSEVKYDGVSPNSRFTNQDGSISEQGMWNFVHATNK